MKLTGITLVKDGNLLGYPWKECIRSLSHICDDVFVNVGDSTDNTLDDMLSLEVPNLFVKQFTWDMSPTGDGRELAVQANNLLSYVDADWILYMQADEMLLESDKEELIRLLESLPDSTSQVELYRTYFWGDIRTRAPEYEIYLGRIFRPGTHKVGGDGMFLVRESGEVYRSDKLIYHYSRMGSEEDITQRVRRLDGLFHSPEVIEKFSDFSYNQLATEALISYVGKHPRGIEDFYGRR